TQTIRDAGKRTLTVETFDEQTAEELVKGQIARHEKMDDLQLLTRGSKGFLGIGKKPDVYQAIISFNAHVKLTYEEKTRIIFTVGPNLIKAVQSGDLQKVQEAFKDGARLEKSNEGGYTPLMLAALYSDEPIVEFLLSKGANVNAATKWGATALTRAAQEGKIRIVELLLSNGVDVNQSEYDGYTALSRAAMNGHYEIVEMLLAKGANLGIKTKHGHTALTLALENRHARIADLLQDAN
ncbi:MAG: ankyrin repeat domain-containing protein, partial [Anaerolineae bacterium]